MSTFSKLVLVITMTLNFCIYSAQHSIPEGTKFRAGVNGEIKLHIGGKDLTLNIHDKNSVPGALSIKEKLDTYQPCSSVALIDELGNPTCFDFNALNMQRILQNPHKSTLSFFQWKKVGNVYEMHCNTQFILKENLLLAKQLGISFNTFNPETPVFTPQTDASFQQHHHPAHIIPHFTAAYAHGYNQQQQFFPHHPHSLPYGPMVPPQIMMPGNPHVIPHYPSYQHITGYYPPQPHHFNPMINHRRLHQADVPQHYSPQQIPAALPSQSVAQPLSPEMQDPIKKMNDLAAQNQQLLELVKEKTVGAIEQKKEEAVTEKIDTTVMDKLVAQIDASGQELRAQQQIIIQMVEEAHKIQHKQSETLEKDKTVTSEGLQETASDSGMGSPLSRKVSTASFASSIELDTTLRFTPEKMSAENSYLHAVQEEPAHIKKTVDLQQTAHTPLTPKTTVKTEAEKEARKFKKQQTRQAERLKKQEDAARKVAEQKEAERLEKEKVKRAKEEQTALKKKHQKDQRESLCSRQMQSHIPALKGVAEDVPSKHTPHKKRQQPTENRNLAVTAKEDNDLAAIAAFQAKSAQEALTQEPAAQPRTQKELRKLRTLKTQGQDFLKNGLYQEAIDIFASDEFVKLNKGKSLLLVEAYRQAERLEEACACLKELESKKASAQEAEEYDYQTALCSIMAAQKNKSSDKNDLIRYFDVLSKRLQENPSHIETGCAFTTLLTTLDQKTLAQKESKIGALFNYLNLQTGYCEVATTQLLQKELDKVYLDLGNPRAEKLMATLYDFESPVQELLETDICPSLSHAATALASALFSKKTALTNDESVRFCLYGAVADSPFYLERSIECLVYLKLMPEPHPVLTRLIPLLQKIAIAKSEKIGKKGSLIDPEALLRLFEQVTVSEQYSDIKEKLKSLTQSSSSRKTLEPHLPINPFGIFIQKRAEFIRKIGQLGEEKETTRQEKLLQDLCTPEWHEDIFDFAKDPQNYLECDTPEARSYGHAIILCIKHLYDTATTEKSDKKIKALTPLIEIIRKTFEKSGNTEMNDLFKENFPDQTVNPSFKHNPERSAFKKVIEKQHKTSSV